MSSPDLHHDGSPAGETQQDHEDHDIAELYDDLEINQPNDYFSVSPHITFEDVEDEVDDDIYRGEPPPEPASPPRTPRPLSVLSVDSSSSSSSSSSSDSSVFGGRLGAISTIVERAISHWARAWVSTSSLSESSSSSSSSRPSIVTASKSILSRRRRRRSSVADTHNTRSEWEVHARIRAREEARQVPREFLLYSPRLAEAAVQKPKARARAVDVGSEPPGVLRTTVLPLILQEMSKSMKNTRRSQGLSSSLRPMVPSDDLNAAPVRQHDYGMPAAEYSVHDYRPVEIEDARTRRRGRKGKQRDAPEAIPVAPQMARDPSDKDANKAWWLDVASPTWEDMRTIGKLLHLHPLTLEDILTQEPREKLELFPKLGYYLVVFRAIESEKTRNRRRLMGTLTSHDGRDELREEGIVGDVNVYLVVFREGICSFHFSDISEHADAVRNKILSPQSDTIAMSSDWIAHGIMDSIVDSFFPLLEQVEREMIHLETVMFSDDDLLHPPPDPPAPEQPAKVEEPKESSGSDTVVSHSSSLDIQIEGKDASPQLSEKPTLRAPHHTVHTKFLIPRRRISTFRQAKSVLQKLISMVPRIHVKMNEAQREQLSHNTVHRVARVRKLVTSLSRILAAKSEVVAQVKKRLLMAGESGLAHGTDSDHDVYVYLGDVQDHILTLQQSLAHYERMLSHSHPTYLAHLRLSATKAKTGSDKAIVVLTIVSMAVLVMQAVLGFNSMNVTIPHNFRGGKRFNVFGIVLAISLCVLFLYGCVVRSWWVRSARRRNWS